MMPRSAFCRTVALVLALSAPATAQDAQPFAAVGRLSYGEGPAPGGAICSGTLVAPDLMLTAGHCVARGGTAFDPASLRFDLGWQPVRFSVTRRGAEITLAPGTGFAADVALVRLDRPVDDIAPLPVADPPSADAGLRVVGFRRDQPLVQGQGRPCLGKLAGDGAIRTGCPVVSGHSGAPLVTLGADGWAVTGVMVAATNGGGPVRSLAAPVPAPFRDRIAAARSP